MQKMGLEGQAPEQAAAAFADKLFQKWGVGDSVCGNGAVLLLAIEDRQVCLLILTAFLLLITPSNTWIGLLCACMLRICSA